ncbi:50S ribosomal protein L37e [Candidatus Woesearchaeota archaeon]|nr:50S ribosomal protein L37e [Candidatus Woesearchaeota archaeon]
MTKGTPSMGRKSGQKNFIRCRRCGRATYHIRKKKCSSCGFGNSSKLRKYSWQKQRTKRKRI